MNLLETMPYLNHTNTQSIETLSTKKLGIPWEFVMMLTFIYILTEFPGNLVYV